MAGVDSQVVLCVPFNGSNGATTAPDISNSGHTLTFVGNAALTTTDPKFGTACLALDGTGDWVTVPDHTDFDFGTGDFTIEFWIWFNSVANAKPISCGGSSSGFQIRYSNTNARWEVYLEGAEPTSTDTSHTPSANTWYHIAVTRSGTNFRFFVEGVQKGSTKTNSTDIQVAHTLYIGSDNGTESLNGKIDALRISKGIARYTADFTPTTEEWSVDGGQPMHLRRNLVGRGFGAFRGGLVNRCQRVFEKAKNGLYLPDTRILTPRGAF